MGLISRRHAALVAVGAMAMSCLWVAPASAASALVVTPNTDLVDFQTVTVDGSGFPPNTSVGLVQCTNGAAVPATDCDLSNRADPDDRR